MTTSKYTKAEEAEMPERQARGETYRQIADAMGRSYHKVWHWFMAEAEVESKSTSPAESARRRLAIATRRFQPTARDQQSKHSNKVVLPKDAFR
jgi:transcriptional regulator with XRE-family HTH domain